MPQMRFEKIGTIATGKPGHGDMMVKTVLVTGIIALVSSHQFCELKGSCDSSNCGSKCG